MKSGFIASGTVLQYLSSRARYAGLTHLALVGVLSAVLAGALFRAPAVPPTEPAASSEPNLNEQSQSSQREAASGPMTTDLAPLPPVEASQPELLSLPLTPAGKRPQPAQKPRPPAPAPPVPVSQVVVAITDAGISPKVVSLVSGGTVTWLNKGSMVHTATHDPITAYPLDSGGLASDQSFSMKLFDAGTYRYTSAPDCLSQVHRPGFDCSDATIVVAPPTTATLGSSRLVSQQQVAQLSPAVVVNVTDRAFVPAKVAIRAGDSVTWINEGSKVHTASAIGPVRPFDSGGLGARQSAKAILSSPGTFAYTSAPDCLNGNRNSTFDCAGSFNITVFASG